MKDGATGLDDDFAALLRIPFDPTLTDPARLRIQAALVALPRSGSIGFTALASALQMTDGNLGRHLSVLVEVGYVETSVTFRGRRKSTWYQASSDGRHAFETHVAALRGVLDAASPD